MAVTRGSCFKLAGAAAAIVMVSATAAMAEEKPAPSPEKGLELAQRFCQGCHLVEDKAAATIPAGVPTFRGIANRRGQTGQHITNVLIQPHAPMPDMRLTSEEIQHILAYLETLRTDKTIAPLAPANPTPKPKYPEHS
jgi:mono/diheme cytochrome c family protein